MIFATVGHQMPFDRLIRAVDQWAISNARDDVFAQIGMGSYAPKHIAFVSFLTPEEFQHRMQNATGIVSHAGTGTIIAAMEMRKPLLVLPRLSKFNETRNDHQIPTARYFSERGSVMAAGDEIDLLAKIGELESFQPMRTTNDQALQQLIRCLREFTSSDDL